MLDEKRKREGDLPVAFLGVQYFLRIGCHCYHV